MRILPLLLGLVLVACSAETTTIQLDVAGMDCDGCVAHVKKALEDIDGVEQVTVDLKAGVATCVVRKGVAPAALVKAVGKDYTATVRS